MNHTKKQAPNIMRITRRNFISNSLAATTACSLCPSLLLAANAPGQRQLKDIGIIGGVPKDMGTDWEKSLRHMAEIGYTELEGGLKGTSPEVYLKFLKEIGLKLVSAGVKFGKKLAPDWLDTAKTLKVRYATIFWPWLYAPEKLTMPQLDEISGQLNLAGEQCKAAGLKLAVHNHDREFRLLEGKPIFDHLLEKTKPDLVTIEMDLYWAVKGGADPVEYFKRYPGRFEIFHVKDMDKSPEKLQAPVGAGTIDFARIFAHSELAGVKHYIVELEGPSNNMKGAEESVRNLKQLKF